MESGILCLPRRQQMPQLRCCVNLQGIQMYKLDNCKTGLIQSWAHSKLDLFRIVPSWQAGLVQCWTGCVWSWMHFKLDAFKAGLFWSWTFSSWTFLKLDLFKAGLIWRWTHLKLDAFKAGCIESWMHLNLDVFKAGCVEAGCIWTWMYCSKLEESFEAGHIVWSWTHLFDWF